MASRSTSGNVEGYGDRSGPAELMQAGSDLIVAYDTISFVRRNGGRASEEIHGRPEARRVGT